MNIDNSNSEMCFLTTIQLQLFHAIDAKINIYESLDALCDAVIHLPCDTPPWCVSLPSLDGAVDLLNCRVAVFWRRGCNVAMDPIFTL